MKIELTNYQTDLVIALLEMHIEGLSQWDNDYAKDELNDTKDVLKTIEYQVNKENEWSITEVE